MSDKHTDPVFQAIADLSRLATDLVVMESIGLDNPLRMANKHSRRITMGDEVRVRKDYLAGPCFVDCTDILKATHEITACRGNLYNTIFEVDVKDLKTGEVLTIKL